MSFKSFIDYLFLEKKYSDHTITSYKGDLNSFLEFNQSVLSNSSIDNSTYPNIRQWIVHLVDSGISNRSINRKISSLNAYYKFLLKIEKIKLNPLSNHKALKTSKKVLVPFSEGEIHTVLDQLDQDDSFESIRNRLIIELFYATGIRRIELVNLKLANVDLVNKSIKVLGKRNKERIIPLLHIVVKSFENYLLKRSQLDSIQDSEFIFLTKKGRKIYENLVYRIINDYFSKWSTKAKCSPHVLRHSFATHLLNEGAELNAVKELLGHSSLAATQVYTHSSIKELKKVHSNSHPRSSEKR